MTTLVSSQAYIYHCHLSKRALVQTKEPYSPRRLSRHNHIETHVLSPRTWTLTISRKHHQPLSLNTVCFAADEPSPSPPSSSEISADARIRSEVLSPFRSVRMFFYLAFIASASLGGLIATSRLIGALANPSRSGEVLEIVKGLGIDVGAASLFAFLYFRENKTKNAQMARLSREENLAKLKMRVEENNKVISVGDLRGIARLVICAGPVEYIEEAFKRSKELTQGLVERGVVVVAYATDGNTPVLEFDETDSEDEEMSQSRRRLWRVAPVFVSEWERWLDEQKKLAGVSSDSPVYLSLRLDFRVKSRHRAVPPPPSPLVSQTIPASMSQVDSRNSSAAKRARTDGGRREDDWTCPSCGNVNFSFRTTCNMRNCTQSRPADHNAKSAHKPMQPQQSFSSPGRYLGSGGPSPVLMGGSPYGSSLFNGSSIPPYDVPFSGGSPYHFNYNSRFPAGPHYRPFHMSGPPSPYHGRSMMGSGMYGMPPPPMDRYGFGMAMSPAAAAAMMPRPGGYFADEKSQKRDSSRENDWACPNCGNVNFSFRTMCNMRKCNTPKPGPQLQQGGSSDKTSNQKAPEGSWKCDSCGNINYPFRSKCNRQNCGADKPGDQSNESPSNAPEDNDQ